MTGCGACGSSWKQPKPLMPAYSRGGMAGLYGLGGYPDCTTFYRGDRAGEAVFVVAPVSPNERLFKWSDYEAATAYAESIGLTQIDSVPVTSMCQQAIDDLYAAA